MATAKTLNEKALENLEIRGLELSEKLKNTVQKLVDCQGLDSLAIETCQDLIDALRQNNRLHNNAVDRLG